MRPAHATTSPSATNHNTTFDDIAPFRDESDLPPGGKYTDGTASVLCAGSVVPGITGPQWIFVLQPGFQTQVLDGEVTNAPLVMTDDSPIDHDSRDRNIYVYPYPQSAKLLASPGNFQTGEQSERGRIEVEWESAALPVWAQPDWSDRVHIEGAHIWDCAHADVTDGFRTEIHPPLVTMSLRDAANEWPAGLANPKLPTRPGWVDTMPGMGSVPVPVTRADIFGSSDGGSARTQETCFSFVNPCLFGLGWYQPLAIKNYDFFVPAPPNLDPNAQLVTKLIKHPFPNCSSDNDCGSLDVLEKTDRITFTNTPTGVAVHVNFTDSPFTEPKSHLYGFGFTLEVGWNTPAAFIPERVKVTVEKVHIKTTMDDAGNGPAAEWEIAAMINGNFKHLLLTETNGDGVGYEYDEGVPTTNDVDAGDYGIKGSGPECALQTDSKTDPGPCQKVFEVTLLPGQPLRISFRAEEDDAGPNFNNPAGAVERILTDLYAIGEKTEWFQERSSAGAIEVDPDCHPDACASITYKIENDPIPAPPQTTTTVGAPNVDQGGETWVTSNTSIGLATTAAAGKEADTFEIHARSWRFGSAAPSESVCGTGTGGATCTLHLDANDGFDGVYNVEYWSVDTTTGATEATQSREFRLDNTPPTTFPILSGTFVRGWYNTPVTVTLFATDGAGVGIDHTTYIVDGGPFNAYLTPFVVTGDSPARVVSFASADKLGNLEPLQGSQFKIDGTAPTLTSSDAFDGAFHYSQDELVNGVFTNASSLAVTYAASDALSGMWDVRRDVTSVPFVGTTTVTVPTGISTHTLVAEDVAGNLKTLAFAIVSVTPLGIAAPQGAGWWKLNPASSTLLDEVNIVSRAFGAPTNRYADVTTANYDSYLTPGANPTAEQKVRRDLLVAWLDFVSGFEPAAQSVDVKSVNGANPWWKVVRNTGGENGSSVTTALNVVRESERRLEDLPPTPYLDTIQILLDKLANKKLK
ncbi:MAG: hypothetical protein ACJ74C_14440 [Gaiellaceae bacterium]